MGLYNISADPYEMVNLRKKFPDIVEALMTRVEYYRQGVVPPQEQAFREYSEDIGSYEGILDTMERLRINRCF